MNVTICALAKKVKKWRVRGKKDLCNAYGPGHKSIYFYY